MINFFNDLIWQVKKLAVLYGSLNFLLGNMLDYETSIFWQLKIYHLDIIYMLEQLEMLFCCFKKSMLWPSTPPCTHSVKWAGKFFQYQKGSLFIHLAGIRSCDLVLNWINELTLLQVLVRERTAVLITAVIKSLVQLIHSLLHSTNIHQSPLTWQVTTLSAGTSKWSFF